MKHARHCILWLVVASAVACSSGSSTPPSAPLSPSPTPAPVTAWAPVVPGATLNLSQQYVYDASARAALVPPPGARIAAWGSTGHAAILLAPAEDGSSVFVGEPGGDVRRIADLDGFFNTASWSPDQRLIAVGSSRPGDPRARVILIDAESGATVREFQDAGHRPGGWSQDSRFLTIAESSGPQVGVTVIEVGTDYRTKLQGATSGAWAHQSDKMAYAVPLDASPSEVYVFDPTNGTKTTLSQDVGVPQGPLSWSPDDSLLAYGIFAGGKSTVSAVDIADHALAVRVKGAWPGGWIDNARMFVTGNTCSTFDLIVVDVPGQALTNLTDSPAVDLYPAYSPASNMFAVTHAGGEISTIDFGAGRTSALPVLSEDARTKPGEADTGPAWSPDGAFLRVDLTPGGGPCEAAAAETTSLEPR